MRTLALAALLAVGALGACKGKPPGHQELGSAAGSGAIVPAVGSNVAPDIVLPHADGSAPRVTTAPISAETLTLLGALQYTGFARDVRSTAPGHFEVRHTTESRPRIMATVLITPCEGVCTPMDLPSWAAGGDALKQYLAPPLRALPDTAFTVGETTLDGVRAIATWQLAYAIAQGSDGNHAGAFSEAYVLYYNDGANEIRVIAEYKDVATKSRADLLAQVPQSDLEHVAKAFADVYTHAW